MILRVVDFLTVVDLAEIVSGGHDGKFDGLHHVFTIRIKSCSGVDEHLLDTIKERTPSCLKHSFSLSQIDNFISGFST